MARPARVTIHAAKVRNSKGRPKAVLPIAPFEKRAMMCSDEVVASSKRQSDWKAKLCEVEVLAELSSQTSLKASVSASRELSRRLVAASSCSARAGHRANLVTPFWHVDGQCSFSVSHSCTDESLTVSHKITHNAARLLHYNVMSRQRL